MKPSTTKLSTFFDDIHIPHSEYLTGMSIGPATMGIILSNLQMLIKNN